MGFPGDWRLHIEFSLDLMDYHDELGSLMPSRNRGPYVLLSSWLYASMSYIAQNGYLRAYLREP